MYADVIVLTYQAPDISYFTYKIPKDLEKQIKIGQLVEVPFGKRNPEGIVVKIHNIQPKVQTKPISKILLPQPLLLPFQIELLKWMADYYLAPMINCLEAILPDIPKAVAKKAWPSHTDTSKLKPGLNQQTLILVPSINRIPETLAKFPKAKNYVVYHNELKSLEKFAAWMKILSGDVDYIFGSRSAIFTPCPNLGEIIIYDEHDNAYKDERSPYLDTLTIAQKISQLTDAQIKIVDPAPKITTYFQLKNHIKMQKFVNSVQIVNMQNEKISGNKSSISFDLETAIQNCLDDKKNVFLFLNKKKESGHLFCKSCKNSEFLQKHPEVCPNCQSPDIFWNVLNTDSLAQETKKLFPRNNVNLIFEKQSAIGNHQSVIDIGTAFALYAPLAKKYDLVAHIQTDSLFNIADFNSAEKLYGQITSLKKLLNTNGKLFLQTYNPEGSAINFAAKNNFELFYKEELKQRKLLHYPPFGMLFKLTIKGKSKEKILKEAENLFSSLSTQLTNYPTIQLLGPYESIFWQKSPSYHIICKYLLNSCTLESRRNASYQIKKLLGNLPKGAQVEVDPDSIQ